MFCIKVSHMLVCLFFFILSHNTHICAIELHILSEFSSVCAIELHIFPLYEQCIYKNFPNQSVDRIGKVSVFYAFVSGVVVSVFLAARLYITVAAVLYLW